MSREWRGEDLPFGTVIQSDRLGTMLIVSPPTQPGVTRSWSGPGLGFQDHAAIWLSRLDGNNGTATDDIGTPTWLGTQAYESDYHWVVVEDPA